MPFLNMFRSRRARSASLPRPTERYLHDSELHDQASMYGPRSTSSASSGYGRRAHHTQPHTSSRAQRYPPYGSSFPNSGAHRYAEAFPTNDQSWYQVEHSDHYPRPNHPRDRDASYYSYSEDGDRHSDVSGGSGVPVPAHSFTTSSRTASPVPTVYRDGTPALGSRLFEQFAGEPPSLARATATVTRLDLREEVEDGYEGSYPAPQSHYSDHHHVSALVCIVVLRTDGHPSIPSRARRRHT
ncbi:hypothetical protein BJV74DRAFT_562204 [Russula compacta]|nr:hypothetical protein BJV74DRAFT_562204 [Russula compacta]